MRNFSLACSLCLLIVGVTGCDSPSESASPPVWYDGDESEAGSNSTVLTEMPEETSAATNKAVQAADPTLGPNARLDFRPFPDDDLWNTPIADAPVDPQSDKILAYIGLDGHLHPDFGDGGIGSPIGIPYIVVDKDQPPVTVKYTDYGDQSDPGPFPIPFDAPIEGGVNGDGDRHVIVIDRDQKKLYELFRAFPVNGGASWRAASGAVFDLTNNTERPLGWTSADAAGLPIFPGLVRYDEVIEKKQINHALRFTLQTTRRAIVPPARHWASRETHPLLPPMGMRVRLKADVDISPYPEEVQVILKALKKYGMILADNGGDWFISGAPDERWDNDRLGRIKKIKTHQLEIIQMDGLSTTY